MSKPEEKQEARCPACGLSVREQERGKKGGMGGLCGPGRCVVKEMVWLVMPSTGEPLAGTFPDEMEEGKP